ncbi:GNAT family N-acetyltransferase [Peribacillus kribbensis]|uniref:GNAT family N-acetyltransferase n=1 Tax=Peribacillus kribbensis TaxID=356658 RepID=UPI0003F5BBDD|nr:GNAT family N-acetyltransferase [Peribacillus kribbensis]
MMIRKAKLSDAEGVTRVSVEGWKTTYKDIMPKEYLDHISFDDRLETWLTIIPNGNVFVAEDEEHGIVGFSSGGKERTGLYDEYTGELYAIYVLEEFQGKGIGGSLLKPVVDFLLEYHLNSMLVWVLEENKSKRFYETLGGKVIDKEEVEFGGLYLTEVAYGWKDIQSLFLAN